MNSEPNSPRPDSASSYSYDEGGRLSEAREIAGSDGFTVATYVYSCALQLPLRSASSMTRRSGSLF